ncbi:MAG: dihydroorotase [Syntrophaceae bacterium]|nr:dihydroorotase [Syntrophaceae bacterium]
MLLIKHAKMLTTEREGLKEFDVLIDGEEIKGIGQNLFIPNASVIDARGKFLSAGLVDAHVHFREPGQEYKEDLRTGSMAAAAGGFTTVIAEPNTIPPIDTPTRLRHLLDLAREKSLIHFYSKVAITKGMRGNHLTDIGKLKEAGAKAISDDGHPILGRKLMRNTLLKGQKFDILVNPHCEESALYREKILRKQERFRQRSLWPLMPSSSGVRPYSSEYGFIKRDLELADEVDARIHISHVSLAKSVDIIANAKKRGVQVTAEATPHHLLLTEKMAKEIGPNAKVNPPLRSEEDVAAVREGLANGTIDIISTDHAPHSPEEKNRPWEEAPFGIIGLETSLGLILTFLVRPGILTLHQAIEKMTILPARIFGLEGLGVGKLKPGVKADLTLIDLDKKWKVDSNRFYSKGRNCPFHGWELCGKAILTIVNGRIVVKEEVMVSDNQRGMNKRANGLSTKDGPNG